jgi:hypothetical protein
MLRIRTIVLKITAEKQQGVEGFQNLAWFQSPLKKKSIKMKESIHVQLLRQKGQI